MLRVSVAPENMCIIENSATRRELSGDIVEEAE